MRNLKYCLVVVATALGMTSRAQAGDIKVIANLSVKADAISADELKGVFLVTRTSLGDGSHVEPVLAKGGATHEAFLKEFLGKTDAALIAYYRSLVFTGKASMPKILGSDAEVGAYVARTKGAVGYVSADISPSGVKTIQVK